MRVEEQRVEALMIYDAPALDPIMVMTSDLGPGQGRIIIECYGVAWSGYWGAMGNRTVREFFMEASTDYLLGVLSRASDRRRGASDYLSRIIEAVRLALRNSLTVSPDAEREANMCGGPGSP